MFKWTMAIMAALSCCIAAQAGETRKTSVPAPQSTTAAMRASGAPLAANTSSVGVPPVEPARPLPADSPEPQAGAGSRWEVKASDVTLARTLERWAHSAGHKLKWDASRNFLIGASDVYLGTFEGALQQVLSSPGIQFSDYPLEACIYANTPPLVRITRQGEQTRECVAATAQ